MVDLGKYSVTSVYKLPNFTFILNQSKNSNNHKTKIMIGDFNWHSQNWGYTETDSNGHELEDWIERNEMTLIHDQFIDLTNGRRKLIPKMAKTNRYNQRKSYGYENKWQIWKSLNRLRTGGDALKSI